MCKISVDITRINVYNKKYQEGKNLTDGRKEK